MRVDVQKLRWLLADIEHSKDAREKLLRELVDIVIAQDNAIASLKVDMMTSLKTIEIESNPNQYNDDHNSPK